MWRSPPDAETLGDLQSLVSDLQTDNAPVQSPSKLWAQPGAGSGWGMRAAVAGVLVVLGIAIGWGLYGNTSSPLSFTSDPGAKSDGITPVVLTPPKQLHSLGGLTGLIEQMKQKFGDTNGYRLIVYPDYASLDRPDPQRRPPSALVHLPRRLGRPHDEREERRRPPGRPGQVRHQDRRRCDARSARDALHEAGRREEHVPEHRSQP